MVDFEADRAQMNDQEQALARGNGLLELKNDCVAGDVERKEAVIVLP